MGFQLWKNSPYISKNVPDYKLVFGPAWNGVQDTPCQSYFSIPSFTTTKTNLAQPIKSLNKSCFAILLHNLADPDWLQVSCEEPIASHVFCLFEKSDLKIEQIYPNLTVFDTECIMLKKECHLFLWYEGNNGRRPKGPMSKNMQLSYSVSLYEFKDLLYSVQTIFPPIYF